MKNKSPVVGPIKAALKRQGYTYESFAGLFGKTEGWFGFLMTGQRRITIDLLYDIAEKLGIDVKSLLPSTDQPEEKLSLEELMRKIAREEIEKNKQKEAK